MIRIRHMKHSPLWQGTRVSLGDDLIVDAIGRERRRFPAGTVFTVDYLNARGKVCISTESGKPYTLETTKDRLVRFWGGLYFVPRADTREVDCGY